MTTYFKPKIPDQKKFKCVFCGKKWNEHIFILNDRDGGTKSM